MCKKQTSVSHSSTKADITPLDAGLRMDGIRALALWDLVIGVFHSVPNRTDGSKREQSGNPSVVVKPNMHNSIPIKHTNVIPTNIDHISSNTTHSGSSAILYVFEDNEAGIKMITKGRSPTMRHVSRTHRVALDWLFDRINLDPKIQIRYIDTKHHLADMLTAFPAPLAAQRISAWQAASSMAKRKQDQKEEEERVVPKSRPAVMKFSSYFIATSSSATSSPIASLCLWMPIASVKPDSTMSVEPSSSTSQVRLKDAYLWWVNGKAAGKPVASRRRRFRRLRQSCGWNLVLQRRTCCPKQQSLGSNPLHTEPVLQLARKVKRINIATHIPLNGSRLLHGQGNFWKTTWRSYERFECECGHLGNVHEYHSSSSSSSRKRLWHQVKICKEFLWRTTGHLFRETEKLMNDQTETTGISLIRFQDLRWVSTSLLHSRAY